MAINCSAPESTRSLQTPCPYDGGIPGLHIAARLGPAAARGDHDD